MLCKNRLLFAIFSQGKISIGIGITLNVGIKTSFYADIKREPFKVHPMFAGSRLTGRPIEGEAATGTSDGTRQAYSRVCFPPIGQNLISPRQAIHPVHVSSGWEGACVKKLELRLRMSAITG